LVTLDTSGSAFGTAYVDDGESNPGVDGTIANRTLTFSVSGGTLSVQSTGDFEASQPVDSIVILGVGSAPSAVTVTGSTNATVTYNATLQRANITGLALDLNEGASLSWA
jgi:alpha-glucosidase